MPIFNFGSLCHWKVCLHSTQNIHSIIPHHKQHSNWAMCIIWTGFLERVSISLNLSVQGHSKIRLNSTDCPTPLQDTTSWIHSINCIVPHLPAVEAKIRGAITKFGQPRVKLTCTLANVLVSELFDKHTLPYNSYCSAIYSTRTHVGTKRLCKLICGLFWCTSFNPFNFVRLPLAKACVCTCWNTLQRRNM